MTPPRDAERRIEVSRPTTTARLGKISGPIPVHPDVTNQPPAAAPTVEVFWRPGCSYCAALKSDLARRGIAAVWRDIWVDRDARAFVRSVNHGNETVPTVRIGERTMTNPTGEQVCDLLTDTQ